MLVGGGAMGLKRIIVERDFGYFHKRAAAYLRSWQDAARDSWRGWSEQDLEALETTLDSPGSYSGGIVKMNQQQFRALDERNRRVVQAKRTVKISPLLVWVVGRGLCSAVKKD